MGSVLERTVTPTDELYILWSAAKRSHLLPCYIYIYTLVSTMTASQFQQCKETTSESFKPAYTFAKIIRKVTNSNRFLKETQLKRASLPAQSSLSPSLIKPIPRRSCQKPPQEFGGKNPHYYVSTKILYFRFANFTGKNMIHNFKREKKKFVKSIYLLSTNFVIVRDSVWLPLLINKYT